ncbi:hypothetical protein COV05_00095 [Candidatus Uhrbacteria bacterium CG10_big_fil_rev_8_21_14_0_10_48_16]|uniref:Methyltransferase n=1 Tax=Candidatus Uhrbacteria bacterium CG10_big_fil_rev_8_21_14_0_10_48_16 TaxID=1975038 RepID=A0A2M8LIF6_9BACT|nr:MAG: hypothetical protein COV05_00095 [Candidatus Uhrbacteria bacterium CG10_big_fil_rev_8_21_14_0_10_48_16]
MKIKTGDLIQLGDHILLCGDSTIKSNVDRLLEGNEVQLVLTDPPYGVSYVESKKGFTQSLAKPKEIANDQTQNEDEYKLFSQAWMECVKPYMARKNSVYIFNSDRMLFALRSGMENAGFKFAQLLIWAKTHAVVGRMDYLPSHELIAYGWFGTHTFHKSKDKTILVCPKPAKSKWHPTSKPRKLLRRLILNSSKVGDTVYEPFAGGGSCLLSCEETKRKCLAIELDTEYCETIVMLWERMTDKKAKKL